VPLLPEYFIYIGTFISFLGGLSYVRLTLSGRVQPNRITWLLLAIIPMIAFFGALDEGVGKQALLSFIVGVNPAMIFIASFVNKKAYWKLGRFDYACGLVALLAVLVWFVSGSGMLAIVFAILADFIAALPTFRKAIFYPSSESYVVFLFGIVNAALVILTIGNWDFATYAFPVYILAFNILIVFLIIWPRASSTS